MATIRGQHLQRSACTHMHTFRNGSICMYLYNACAHTYVAADPLPCCRILRCGKISKKILVHVLFISGYKFQRFSQFIDLAGISFSGSTTSSSDTHQVSFGLSVVSSDVEPSQNADSSTIKTDCPIATQLATTI